MSERIQVTKLEISNTDREQILNLIRKSSNFKSLINADKTENDYEQSEATYKIQNFRYPEFQTREVIKIIDNYPTRLYLTIYNGSNVLTYQKIED